MCERSLVVEFDGQEATEHEQETDDLLLLQTAADTQLHNMRVAGVLSGAVCAHCFFSRQSACQLAPRKAMELNNEIPAGSVDKLRKLARGKRMYVYKNVQMLANATQYAFSLDQFLPAPAAPDAPVAIDALERKPTLIFCADEEAAQPCSCKFVGPCCL